MNNRIIGYGILVFVIGFFVGMLWIKYLQWLMLIGTVMTYWGIFRFFKYADLESEFRMEKGEDFLTYFWNRIVLKLWTSIFAIWMLVMVTYLFATT